MWLQTLSSSHFRLLCPLQVHKGSGTRAGLLGKGLPNIFTGTHSTKDILHLLLVSTHAHAIWNTYPYYWDTLWYLQFALIQLFKDCWCDSFNCFHDPPMVHHSNECQCSRMPASSATNNGPLSHRAGGNKAVFPKSSICFPGILARPPWEESICSQQQDVRPQFLKRGTLGISANTRLYGVCITGSVVIQRPWPVSIRRP